MDRKNKCPKASSDGWIKCQSKTRPGKFYLFNKTTGETKWCKEDTKLSPSRKALEKPQSPPKWKMTKTPAQDRLKRLQNKLQVESKEKHKSKEKDKPREKNNNQSKKCVIKEKSAPEKKNTSPKATTSKQVSQTQLKQKVLPSSSTLTSVNNVKANVRTSPIRSPKRIAKKRRTSIISLQTEEKPQELPPGLHGLDEDSFFYPCTSTAITIGSGIVNKIKKICQTTVNGYQSAKKALVNDAKTKPAVKKPVFKIPKKEKIKPQVLLAAAKEQKTETIESTETPGTSNIFKDFVFTELATAITTTTSPCNTPGNLNISAYEKGTANSRLARLRSSLLQQTNSDFARLMTNVPADSVNCRHNESDIEISSEVEPMDWTSTVDIKNVDEVSSNPSITQCSKDKKITISNEKLGDTIGEYYDRVNENLLRFAAEQHPDIKPVKCWFKEFYYFVLDTNVMLRHLAFVEDLSEMKLCDTSGTMLYIPYSVLQELDKLKMRANSESAKVLAVRAIKYLNINFENKNIHLQAQSAIDELEHLIDVNSADDSILNCCLQVKQKVPHIILLTEDANLRSKAICNNILVSTKSDLVSHHASSPSI